MSPISGLQFANTEDPLAGLQLAMLPEMALAAEKEKRVRPRRHAQLLTPAFRDFLTPAFRDGALLAAQAWISGPA